MIDLNTIISNALTAAITTAVAPLTERITALEEKVTALETKLTEAALFAQTNNVTITIDEAKMVEALNSQEWFWEKMQRFAVGAAEEAMDAHLSDYDHDEYDSHIGDDDKHFEGDIEDAVRDALSNMTFDVSIR